MAAVLYHSALHYNYSNKQKKRITVTNIKNVFLPPSNWQQFYITAQCITIAVTSKAKLFLPPSTPAVVLNHSAVHYNSSNKQQ